MIPDSLTSKKRWCVWKSVLDEDKKQQKKPWRTDGLGLLSWGNPLNLITYQDALRIFEASREDPAHTRFAGIGYILPEGDNDKRLVCLDLDRCIDEKGNLSPGAQKIIHQFGGYIEYSPSGKGLHLWFWAVLPHDFKNISTKEGKKPLLVDGQKVEVFVRKHFVTVTGNIFQDGQMEDKTAGILGLYALAKTQEDESEPPKTKPPSSNNRYAEKALESAAKRIREEPEGNRNNVLNEESFSIGTLVGGGYLNFNEAERELFRAARYSGLPENEAKATIKSGLKAGRKEPRKIEDQKPAFKPLPKKEEPKHREDDIREKALKILKEDNPVDYITNSCSRMVLGAEKAFKKLVCCVSAQNVKQTAGLHPKLNGESGMGKTIAASTFAHHLPPEMVVRGSTSNMAAFYHPDGDRVFRILDDYLAGNEVLDTIIKQTSSFFHQQYEHRTVRNQLPVKLFIGSEQTWAITSVDSSQDIQVLNRQIPINIDDSEDLTKRVNNRTVERYGLGQEQYPEDEQILISREIWRILREEGTIGVKIPYWKRIEWLDCTNRRNPSIFMDLLVSLTAMNRYQRQKDDEGYYLATESDFNCAKALFTDKDAEELVKRLTKKEREFAELLMKSPSGLTREEVAQEMDISVNRVSQLANGEKGKGGLTQKLPGFSVADITDTTRVSDDEKRSIRRVVYKLDKYNSLSGFDAVVTLKPDTGDDDKDGKNGVSFPVRKGNNKEINNGIERIEREKIVSKESKFTEGEKDTVEKNVFRKVSYSDLPQNSNFGEESISGGSKSVLTHD